MKKIIIVPILIFSINVYAQKTNLTNNATYGQRYQEQIENNTAKPNTPLYGGGVNNNSNQGGSSTEMFEKGYWNNQNQKQINQRVENQRVAKLLEEEKKKNDKLELEQRVKDNYEYNKELKQKRELSLSTITPIIAKEGMNYTEAREVGETQIYLAHNNIAQDEDYAKTARNLSEFRILYNTESFETLLTLVWNAFRYPISTTECLNELKKRFPQKIDTIEKSELLKMCAYFGGYRPSIKNVNDIYYPKSIVETYTAAEVKDLFKRFYYLSKKYPAHALRMAANCRQHLSPYYLEAFSWNEMLNNNNKEIRFEACKNILYSTHNLINTNSNDDKASLDLIYDRLKEPIEWIRKNYPNYFAMLSESDWKKMAIAQGMPISYIRYAITGYNGTTDYWQSQYPILYKLVDNAKKTHGSYKNKDGSNYEGDLFDGIREGVGTYNYANGDSYTGDWKSNQKDGVGTYQYANGNVYTGDYKNDYQNGNGVSKKANGSYAKGTFKNNDYYNVIYYNASNKEITKVEFLASSLQKNVSINYGDNFFTGDVKDGKPNGKGTYKFKSGSIYEGDFKDGKFDGKGTIKYADSSIYIGYWKNGLYDGNGAKKYKDGVGYTGEWKENKRNGKGVNTNSDSSILIGTWVNDIKEGSCTFKYPNGDYKTGEYVKNKREGIWTYFFINKTISKTNYVNNKRNGEYLFTKINGYFQKIMYVDDEVSIPAKYYNNNAIEITKEEFMK